MTTRNAQIEQCTWRESLIPSPKEFSYPFQSPLLHSPVNEKFASLSLLNNNGITFFCINIFFS